MKQISLVISLFLVGLAACRRTEDRPSPAAETNEILEPAVESDHPAEPELIDDPKVVPRRVGGSTHNDPEYTRIVDEIAACNRELKPLEDKLVEQNQVIDEISKIFRSENEVPEEVMMLLRERQSTRASIQSISDRKQRLFKEGEEWMQRHRD